MKPLRSRAYEKIDSVGRIALMMKVYSHIFNLEFLGWLDDDERVVYVNMKAPENEYTAENIDTDHVELVQ